MMDEAQVRTSGLLNRALVIRRGRAGRHFWGLFATGAIAAIGVAQAARAQDNQTPQTNEVVVTAQKRSENIQDVPFAVSVVGSQLFTDAHVTELNDLGGYVPGLVINSSGSPGQTQVTIRGIAVLSQGSTVGTYIDDSPIGGSSLYSRSYSFALDLLPYDVDRLEVLRGPQGTLYGASTLGGLLKYVLTEPSLEKFQERAGADLFSVSGAGQAGYGGRAMISGPVIPGSLGFLASYAYEGTPGYIDNTTTGQKDDNALAQQSARLALLWRPNEALKVRLDALYQQIDSQNNAEVPVGSAAAPKPILGDLKADNPLNQPFRKDVEYYGAEVNYNLGWATLVSSSSYSYSDVLQETDYSSLFGTLFPLFGQPAGLSSLDIKLQTEKYTEEVRLASPAGARIEWQIGSFDTYEHSTNHQLVTAQSDSRAPIGALTPFDIAGFAPALYREYAGFADVTFHVTDRLDIGGGLRYSENVQDFHSISGGLLGGGTVSSTPGHSSQGVLTYSFNPQYHFTKDISSYIRIASGYAPGGPNVLVPGVPTQVGSETLTNYEIGLKSEFFQKKLLFDIDAFYIQWSNIQVDAATSEGVGYLLNGGTAKSEGIEANGTLRPFPHLALSGSFTYIDAQLTENIPAIGGLSGEELPEVPRYSGAVRADYSRQLDAEWTGHIGGGVRMVSSELSGVLQDAAKLPGYAVLDLDLNVSNGRYTFRLYAKNLNDSRALTSFQPYGAPQGYLLQPRIIGLAIDSKF